MDISFLPSHILDMAKFLFGMHHYIGDMRSVSEMPFESPPPKHQPLMRSSLFSIAEHSGSRHTVKPV